VAACTKRNNVPVQGLYLVVKDVGELVKELRSANVPTPDPPKLVPAVPIKHSVKADYLVCLEDGKRLVALKRYLRWKYNLTPQEYREKWGLSKDYPMTCSSYQLKCSKLALEHGLGRKPRVRRKKK
jgi:predicted transcriptional regulator